MTPANTSAARALAVLEAVAADQPIGVSELTRRLDADKSAVQRALLTLAECGWIRPTDSGPTRWEMTDRIQIVAHTARHPDDMRERARAIMLNLRDETGETVILNIPDAAQFVVAEVVESRQILRAAPFVGMTVSAAHSATGRAVLAFMPPARQAEMLGHVADRALLDDFAEAIRQGWFVHPRQQRGVSTNIAAPVFGRDGQPIAALVLSAPSERLPPSDYPRLGALVARFARLLSSSDEPNRQAGVP